MRATCVTILALVCLVVTNLAIIISFATPYWLEQRGTSLKGNHNGLWAACDSEGCNFIFKRNVFLLESDHWFKAVQALYSIGFIAGLMSLLIATLALCCHCKNCNAEKAVAGLLMIALLTMGVALIIYAIKMDKKYNAGTSFNDNGNSESTAKLSWSYWLGIGACGITLITSIFYACEGRYRETHLQE